MPYTITALSLLRQATSNAIDEAQILLWWNKNKLEDENLCSTLIRFGIFRPLAERTIRLIEKGFLKDLDNQVIFEPQGLERLREAIRDVTTYESTIMEAKRATVIGDAASEKNDGAKEQRVPQVGDVLGRCLLTGIIGSGGYGTVFSALHQTLNMPVAVKILITDRLGSSETTQDTLRREARLLARITHPNIVRVMDFDDSSIPYFVMEFVEGPSLADLINQTGGLRQDKATKIMMSVIEALAAGWGHQIVHRDIKPGNILLTKAGHVKLADLGLAFVRGSDVATSESGTPIGTCTYMAPEQIRNEPTVDFRADIYALGCTFYHALTGSLPFPGKHPREVILKHLQVPLKPLEQSHANLVSPSISRIIQKMTSKSPDDRYQSYEELLTELNETLENPISDSEIQNKLTVPELIIPISPPSSKQKKSGLFGWWFKKE